MNAQYSHQDPLDCLQIEVTTHCNLRCPECVRTLQSARKQWKNRHMPTEVFGRIIQTCPNAAALIVQGVGEPTLHPDFPELLTMARHTGKFHDIFFYTNGLAKPPSYYLHLLETGLSDFVISVDSLDPAVASACRDGTDVARLRQLLAAMVEISKPRICMVLSKKNLGTLPVTLAGLNALGPMNIAIQPLANFRPGVGDNSPNEHVLDVSALQTYETMKPEFKQRYPNLEIGDAGLAYVLKRVHRVEFQEERVYCKRPFVYPYITVDGYLTPCCLVYEPEVFGRTSLAKHSFSEAWGSPPVQSWLCELVTATPAVCKNCVLNPS